MYSIRCVLIFLTVIGAFLNGYSQTRQDSIDQANEYLEQANLMKAASQADNDIREVYELAANTDPRNVRANFEAGYYRLITINKDLAAKYFLRVYDLDPNYRFDIEYLIGLSYQFGFQFDRAIEYFQRYVDKYNKRPNFQGQRMPLEEAERRIYECENSKTYVAHPHGYSIVNMGSYINSEFDDYAPVFNEDETEMIFTSRRRDGNSNEDVADDNKPFEEIFISMKENGQWQPAKNLQGVNSPYHESTLALTGDGKTLFVYKDVNRGDIFVSELQSNGTWSEPEPLPGVVNSSYEENSVSVSADQQTIYFSSNRPGGFGGLDIYSATVDSKGQWTNVKNLGAKINTPYDEDGPFIDYDGKTLYFSTKGREGMGGYDLYKSLFDAAAKDWGEPVNMGYPVNTPDNDIFIVISKDGKRAYYSSVREDAIGYDDIYMINLVEDAVAKNPEPKQPDPEPEPEPTDPEPLPDPEPQPDPEPVKEPVKTLVPLTYAVKVIDAGTKQPLDATVKLQGASDNIVVGSTRNGVGEFQFNINATAAKNYRLSVESDGFVFVNQTISLPGAGESANTINKTIEMQRLAREVSGVLRNIYFDFDKATFKQESYNELNKLERMLQQNSNLKVEISGHTDAVGSKAYNKFLSQKRAEAVKDFLTKKGIDPRRITAVGYGETKPLVSNDDETEGREINRRVEFKVIGN